MQTHYRRKRRGFGLVRYNILQPVPVNTYGRGAPGTLQIADQSSFRKTFHELFSSIGQREISEISQKLRGGSVKIALRHRGVSSSSRSEKSFYISPAFLQQSLRVIFRMTWKCTKRLRFLFFTNESTPPSLD